MEERFGANQAKETVPTSAKIQWLWSVQYIDAPVVRWRDGNCDGDLTGGTQEGDNTLYYATDANMNVTLLVNTDGSVAERYVYDPYGTVKVYSDDWNTEVAWSASKKNNIRYCGYYFDNETGLDHVRNRYYLPPLGRWITWDPIGFRGGLNTYEALHGKAVSRTDPFGLMPNRDDAIGWGKFIDQVRTWESSLNQVEYWLMRMYCPCGVLKLFQGQIWSNVAFGTQTFERKTTDVTYYYDTPFGSVGATTSVTKTEIHGEPPKESLDEGLGWRYFYTASKGWIDLGHFSGHAVLACFLRSGVSTDVEAASMSKAVGMAAEEAQALGARGPGTVSVASWASAWTKEDIYSNELGAHFGLYWRNHSREKTLSEALIGYVVRYGPFPDPSKAPDWADLPQSEAAYERQAMSMSDEQRLAEVAKRAEAERPKALKTLTSIPDSGGQ